MERTVSKCLLEIGAIYCNGEDKYFASNGMQVPLRCDNRYILAYPRVRKVITKWLTSIVGEHFSNAEIIVGTATAGIPLAVMLSESLKLPMGYVLKSEKNYKYKKISDEFFKNYNNVVLIDDVICTGKTMIEAVKNLRENDVNILGVISIFSYDLESTKEKLAKENIKYISLTNLDILSLVAMQTGKISFDQYQRIMKFKENPKDEIWA